MTLHCIPFLVLSTLLANVSIALATSDSIMTFSELPKVFRSGSGEMNADPSPRYLRTQASNSEERVGPVSRVEKLKSLITPSTVSEKTLQRWKDKEKSADTVFVRLGLKTTDKLFDSKQFPVWVEYVDKYGSAINTLTSYFGDRALFKMIIAAQKIPKTQALATQLHTRQLKYWLTNIKNPADVYKLMMLDKAGDKLVENPQFMTWLSYLDDFNAKFRGKAQSRISILSTIYGDEALSTMLLQAMHVRSVADIATKLHSEQIQRLLAAKTSPVTVFKILMLDKAGKNLLDNPMFSTWAKYVDDLNMKTANKKTSLLSALKNHYNKEDLAKMVDAAKKTPGLEKKVERLEIEQTKDIPDELFKRLKLDKAGGHLLDHPGLNTWINFIKGYNKDNPKYQTTLISTMVYHYGDKRVIQILNAAKDVKSTAIIAKRLQTELFQLWLQKRWPPSYTFELMNLDTRGNNLLSSPEVTTWTKYLNLYNTEYPRHKTTLLETIRSVGYSDKRMIQLLDAAKRVPRTEDLATKLHSELVQHWLAMKKSPNSVFVILGLNNAGDNLLRDPRFRAWIQYTDDFTMKFPTENLLMPKTLREYYRGNALAKMVETAKKDPRTEDIAKRVEGQLFSLDYK
ncbi:RxLR effector family protein [Phytophthora palmivora]|uniref:RxLR effector family protein n=1 Tax=Phytophthora palmivora TaxID=4796 RepID=A0A2P4X886_9STRA|nr:RxLR effector family protein [Phytophthora palmivora]